MKTKQVSPSPQEIIAGTLKRTVISFSEQALNTFEHAFTFTLGLQTHELVISWSNSSWDHKQFISWLFFMLLAFVFPKIRDICCGKTHPEHNGQVESTNMRSNLSLYTNVNRAGQGSAHHGYYDS